jgi:hypothetical protein
MIIVRFQVWAIMKVRRVRLGVGMCILIMPKFIGIVAMIMGSIIFIGKEL